MKKSVPNDSFTTQKTYPQTIKTDDIDYIDPVDPAKQSEQQDKFFNQMGSDQNTKFVEQKDDDNKPVGSSDGEYKNDDENADIHPAKESILHEISQTVKKH